MEVAGPTDVSSGMTSDDSPAVPEGSIGFEKSSQCDGSASTCSFISTEFTDVGSDVGWGADETVSLADGWRRRFFFRRFFLVCGSFETAEQPGLGRDSSLVEAVSTGTGATKEWGTDWTILESDESCFCFRGAVTVNVLDDLSNLAEAFESSTSYGRLSSSWYATGFSD